MDFIFFLFSHKFFSFCLLFVLSSSFLIIRKVLQRYTFLHKTSGNENISVLNFIKSNNLKVDGYKNSVRTASLPNSNAISVYPITTSRVSISANFKPQSFAALNNSFSSTASMATSTSLSASSLKYFSVFCF